MRASEKAGAELEFNVSVYFRWHSGVSFGAYDSMINSYGLKYMAVADCCVSTPQYKHTWKGHNNNHHNNHNLRRATTNKLNYSRPRRIPPL